MGLLDLPKSISNDYLAYGECGLEQGDVVELRERADMAFGCLGTADMLLALAKSLAPIVSACDIRTLKVMLCLRWILIDNFTVDLSTGMRYV